MSEQFFNDLNDMLTRARAAHDRALERLRLATSDAGRKRWRDERDRLMTERATLFIALTKLRSLP